MKIYNQLLVLATVLLPITESAPASIVTQPTSLNAGDEYRLVFVTSGARNATATNIAEYNMFVQSAAEAVPALLSLGVDWRVIGATASVNARENTDTDPNVDSGVPIFLLNDRRIATNYADLWDGILENDLSVTEQGNPTTQDMVWTGSLNDGLGSTQPLGAGAPLYGDATPALGGPTTDTPGDRNGWMFDWALLNGQSHVFYAMSDVLTIPTSGEVPEPASGFVWFGICGAALTMAASKKMLARR